MKFHITPDGPRPCRATVRNCPVGGDHHSDEKEAWRRFEETQDSGAPSHSRDRLPRTQVVSRVVPMVRGQYYGCHVDKSSLSEYLEEFRAQAGEESSLMESAKAARDRGYVYHLTAIRPPEMRKLKGKVTDPPQTVTVTYTGLGRVTEGDNEAWFVTCSSPEIEKWRSDNGLPVHDLHITLAFKNKDVHSRPKGSSSIVTK